MLIWVKSRAIYQEPIIRRRLRKMSYRSRSMGTCHRRYKFKRCKEVQRLHLVIAKWWPSKWRKKSTMAVCIAATWNHPRNSWCSRHKRKNWCKTLLVRITNTRGGSAALPITVMTLIRQNSPKFNTQSCKTTICPQSRRITLKAIARRDLEIIIMEQTHYTRELWRGPMILKIQEARVPKGIMRSS